MRAVSDYIYIVVSYSISNNPRSPRSAPVGDPGPPREVAGKARLGPYMYCNVLYSVQLIKGRFCYCTLYTGFGHAEKVPKLCIPPLITTIRSGVACASVRRRAPCGPRQLPTLATAADRGADTYDSGAPRSAPKSLRSGPSRRHTPY